MFDREKVLQEFDQEMAVTRRTLEQVPADRLDWKPHEKSTPLGQLAHHLTRLPSWIVSALNDDELDLAELADPSNLEEIPGPRDMLELFDSNVQEARKALRRAKLGSLEDPWTLRSGEEVLFTLPRWSVVRMTVLNHMVHHRAQLGVYLRLLDLSVPKSYGPTADHPA